MSKFKPGERVRVYSFDAIYKGFVVERLPNDKVTVRLDGGGLLDFHIKQLRRLKPKVKKEPRQWSMVGVHHSGLIISSSQKSKEIIVDGPRLEHMETVTVQEVVKKEKRK
jgi:hypothetical protein